MNRIVNICRKHFLLADLLFGAIVSVIVISAVCLAHPGDAICEWLKQDGEGILTVIATVSGALLGFVITGVSIMIALTESGRGGLLKGTKHYRTIFRVYFSAIRWLALSTILPIVSMILEDDLGVMICYAIVFSTVISSLRLWRCVWVLSELVEISSV